MRGKAALVSVRDRNRSDRDGMVIWYVELWAPIRSLDAGSRSDFVGLLGVVLPRQQQHHHVNGQSTSSASDIVPMLRQLQDGQQSMQRHLANIKYDVIQQGKELGELRKWVVGDVLSKLSA